MSLPISTTTIVNYLKLQHYIMIIHALQLMDTRSAINAGADYIYYLTIIYFVQKCLGSANSNNYRLWLYMTAYAWTPMQCTYVASC